MYGCAALRQVYGSSFPISGLPATDTHNCTCTTSHYLQLQDGGCAADCVVDHGPRNWYKLACDELDGFLRCNATHEGPHHVQLASPKAHHLHDVVLADGGAVRGPPWVATPTAALQQHLCVQVGRGSSGYVSTERQPQRSQKGATLLLMKHS